MELETRAPATWEGKTAEWRKKLPAVLRALPSSKSVSKESHDAALSEITTLKRTTAEEVERAVGRSRELEEENITLRKRLADNEACLPRILIAEGEPLIAEDLQLNLLKNRYDVVGIARTKEEAIVAALEHRAEIILTETALADGSSGIELINHLYSLLDCVAIFVTAYPERLLSGTRPEPVFLVTKPFTPDMIVQMVGNARTHLLERRALAQTRTAMERPAK
ncbi:hypothetical protein ACQ7C1_09285 [Rhizobium sp. Nf11,1]